MRGWPQCSEVFILASSKAFCFLLRTVISRASFRRLASVCALLLKNDVIQCSSHFGSRSSSDSLTVLSTEATSSEWTVVKVKLVVTDHAAVMRTTFSWYSRNCSACCKVELNDVLTSTVKVLLFSWYCFHFHSCNYRKMHCLPTFAFPSHPSFTYKKAKLTKIGSALANDQLCAESQGR